MTIDRLYLELVRTPTGAMRLVTDSDGALRRLDWAGEDGGLDPSTPRDRARIAPPAAASRARRALEAYFDGDIAAIEELAARPQGTEFQRQVWAALRKIPAGATASYGEIAAQIGQKNAARAVGMANNRNPIAIVIPCHRVIGANGALIGYGGGLERKLWLLRHEGAIL